MKIRAKVHNPALRDALDQAAARLGAEVLDGERAPATADLVSTRPDIILLELGPGIDVDEVRADARRNDIALLVAANGAADVGSALVEADDWVTLPTTPDELSARLTTASQRAALGRADRDRDDAAELVRYEELLYDKL
ncbi:MAG: hypothetical protein ACREM1_01435, partial [Longimicrobiales bacterium]